MTAAYDIGVRLALGEAGLMKTGGLAWEGVKDIARTGWTGVKDFATAKRVRKALENVGSVAERATPMAAKRRAAYRELGRSLLPYGGVAAGGAGLYGLHKLFPNALD